ncbi:DUF4885 family protein [Arcobacter porcinus]|uniref:DUF4885 family protein n=1 Tax=Arcobacter porcinus TaxID=1935204 RepID=UPI0008271774|nr:DUF4885 family protein [Arcobacter porcinus]OCL83018.1 hypothetical protein AAW30_01087 [Arcobacter porcinus]OCL88894.1 hypothetical protein AAX30_00018 [Arcobacter porcinus]
MRIDTNTPQSFSSLNGAIKVTYTNNTSQTENSKSINEPVKLNIGNNETIINARLNGYVNTEYEKKLNILKEHYSKMYQENIKFENPIAHISDKYYTENSPYYIKGLTKEERVIAVSTEISHINLNGKIEASLSFQDAVLRNERTPTFGDVMRAEENTYDRVAVNSQFQTLLSNHGITIPKDEKLTFTIEPNYFTLKVNGAKDENLASAIEDILNKNSENVKQLFLHISYVKSDDNTQFTKEKQDKFGIVSSVKEFTGYNLADLEIKDGRFLAPNGEDLFKIFKDNFDKRYPNPGFDKNTILIYHENQLTELAKKGFLNVPDLILSIEYENGSFYDIGQKENFGTGKTAWIEEWNIAKTSEYNSAQDKINYQSKYTENPSDFTRSINKYDLIKEIEDVTGFNLNDLKEVNGKFLTKNGEDVFELYKKNIQSKYFFSKDLQEAQINHYGKLLNELSKIGLNNIANFEPKKDEDLMQILDKIEPFEIYV